MEPVRVLIPEEDDLYPSSDGKPMAESDFQCDAILYIRELLLHYFEPIEDVYVSSNLLIYYEEDNPGARVAPDVFVVCEMSKHKRMSYKIWEEGKAPDVVIEVTSKSTRHYDEGDKAKLYLDLGVREYFQYDPTGDYIPKRLKGRKNVGGKWIPMGPVLVPRMRRSIECRALDLTFCVDQNGDFRVWSLPEQCFLEGGRELRQNHRKLVGKIERFERENKQIEQEKLLAEGKAARLEEENAILKQKLEELSGL